ncbi:Rap1a/Tai family immunity protein [Sphingorhabdus contaminans]|uniref:Rap1a/Tai family immunity protein n=1 Tax=Sphingorhabdus contaminans TaxID=1343899 RepID=UPI003D29B73F
MESAAVFFLGGHQIIMFKPILAIATVALSTVPLKAEPWGSHYFIDGNRLYADCKNESNDSAGLLAFGSCRGFIFGAFDTFAAVRAESKQPSCLPEGVNAGQIVDIVVQHLRDNPARRHEGATFIVARAVEPLLIPCPPKPQK